MAILKNTVIDDTGFVVLPSGTTAERPASPTAGMIRYNTTIAKVEQYTGSSWDLFVQETVPTANRATGGSRTLVNGNYIHKFTYDLIHNSLAESTQVHNDANWRTMKTFSVTSTGTIDVRFTAYISSGSYYWAYRIRKNSATTMSSGGYQTGPFWASDESSVHEYRRFISRDLPVTAGDSITVEMISSTGGESAVTGNGQTLYLKDLLVYQNGQQFIPENDGIVEVLVVGAGGGGGADVGGGGGGGQVVYSTTFNVLANTPTNITVGDGAYHATPNQFGATGRSSSISTPLQSVTGVSGTLGGGSQFIQGTYFTSPTRLEILTQGGTTFDQVVRLLQPGVSISLTMGDFTSRTFVTTGSSVYVSTGFNDVITYTVLGTINSAPASTSLIFSITIPNFIITDTLTAQGGGGGNGRTGGGVNPDTGWTGGGGAHEYSNSLGNGGYAGGDSAGKQTPTNGCGGGGGAGGPGIAGTTSQAGRGGPGIAYDITGQTIFYGAGGGGSYYSTTNTALAGLGGRGQNDTRGRGGVEAAGSDRIIGIDGQNDVGAGGGGGPTSNLRPNAGKGGSGIVVIRFPALTSDETLGTSGNPAVNGLALLAAGKPSGIYFIQPSGHGSAVQCYVDNDNDGGGWVLIHKHNSTGSTSDTNDRTDGGYNLIGLQSPTFYSGTQGEVAIAPLTFNNSTSFSTWRVSTPSIGAGRAKMFWHRQTADQTAGKLAYYTTDKSSSGDRITLAFTYYKWNNRQGYFLDDAFNSGSHGLCVGDWDSNYSSGQHICVNRFCCGTPNGGLWMNSSNGTWRLEDDVSSTAIGGGDEFALLGWAR